MSAGRRPVSALGSLHHGEIINEPTFIKKKLDERNPDKGGNLGFGVCRVVNIDYEEHYVTLRTVIGTEQEFERVPAAMTYPGAGARHFFGAMPEVGDYCVVGWLPQESAEPHGGTATPMILSWIIPGVWPGRDWLTTAAFTEDEHSSKSSRDREEIHGVFDQIRHKLRHIQPGNILASSSQGSDLVLDESATLSNRRGNEFILRDEDQAVITRALQQFTALAGTRVYSGMVQRDALRLPTTMFSDGYRWDGDVQAIGGTVLGEESLPVHGTAPAGYLLPDSVFHRTFDSEGKLNQALYSKPDYLDPYVFLRNGGYIDEDGIAVDSKHLNDAVYGGKNIFRVSQGSDANATLNPGASTLTEHRVELAHTSDGRLPVTEQTDGFDAERLPDGDPDTPRGADGKALFIEYVMGSVVGNDPFSGKGRKQYAMPLVAQVFDSMGGLSPRIEAARVAPPGKPGGTPLGEHAATLFRLTPPVGGLAPSWWSMNKKGQVKLVISGPPTEFGLDVAISGGMRLAVGGGLELMLKGGIHFSTLSKASLRMRSEQGPVLIYGGGTDRSEESTMERVQGSNGGDKYTPSVDVHAQTNMRLRAEKRILLKGQQVEVSAKSVKVMAYDEFELSSSKQVTVSSEDIKFATSGKRTDNFTGPKQLIPTNGALHERNYTPNYPGVVAEEVTYEMGDRNETFNLGNHKTSIVIGNMTYQTLAGTWKAAGGPGGVNQMSLGPSGLQGTVPVGNIALNATAGAISMVASVSVLIQSNGGPAVIRSSSSVALGAMVTGPDVGPIITAGSLEPFTGKPFLTWGMGAKAHLITG